KMRAEGTYHTKIYPILCSVLDHDNILKTLKKHKVDTLYHAAAYKHVPLLEVNPLEAIRNNVLGMSILCSATIKARVAKFILISSDKAVRPKNIMGATKRIAELICIAKNDNNHNTKFLFVRFGNVIGSSGSVIPLFQEQINDGGPITITDENITRYFMTTTEAAELVIQAGAMANGNDFFVLDMGEPIRILDIAKNMARINGLNPVIVQNTKLKDTVSKKGSGYIDINITGLRLGEKLHEELFLDHEPKKSKHPKIYRGTEEPILADDLDALLDQLKCALETFNTTAALEALDNPHVNYSPSSTNKPVRNLCT
ncbi:polysaccharide biosynthesis protein, partial [Alphaproteobacteria bacterium]|nr:polysaccharide biosynthesis protein [Alphaproteobacteria bacterium]